MNARRLGFIVCAVLGWAFPANAVSDADVRAMIVRSAMAQGSVPPRLALAVAEIESDFVADAESVAGARGVMQIMPATARYEFGVTADALWDPETNVRIGIAFLAQLHRRYGAWDLALSHYNGGTLDGIAPHAYTRDYVSRVFAAWARYERSNHTGVMLADLLSDLHSTRNVRKGDERATSFSAETTPALQGSSRFGLARDTRQASLRQRVRASLDASELLRSKRARWSTSSYVDRKD